MPLTARMDRGNNLLVIENSTTLANATLSPSSYADITITFTQKVYDADTGEIQDGHTFSISVTQICTVNDFCPIYYDGTNASRHWVRLPDGLEAGVYYMTIVATFANSDVQTSEVACVALDTRLVCDLIEKATGINEVLAFYLLERGQTCDCSCERLAVFYYTVREQIPSTGECNDCV